MSIGGSDLDRYADHCYLLGHQGSQSAEQLHSFVRAVPYRKIRFANSAIKPASC